MLRIAIPYGTLSSRQMRMLAHIARRYDKGYGHFTTRQNIQFNWPAAVGHPGHPWRNWPPSRCMPSRRLSATASRNVTAEPFFAGAAADEVADPRPLCGDPEAVVSSVHPEFSFLADASSRSRSPARSATGRRLLSGPRHRPEHLKRNEQGELGVNGLCRRRAGPHAPLVAKKLQGLPARGGSGSPTPARDHALVYNLSGRRGTTSTHFGKGPHQDPRPRDGHRGNCSVRSRGRIRSAQGQRTEAAPIADIRAIEASCSRHPDLPSVPMAGRVWLLTRNRMPGLCRPAFARQRTTKHWPSRTYASVTISLKGDRRDTG